MDKSSVSWLLFLKLEEDKMEYIDLKNEIMRLIELHSEGEYWDFKQQWHSNNANLLHDIICMANSPANRDCYIIIGIEDITYKILGVNDENRKNQQNVIDLLRQKPFWAGGYIPEVYVKTIYVEDKEIDVVVVKQSNNTPFYLLKDYEKDKKKISKGAIYTRKGDTNTPKTETADVHDTEILWKRRFGLLYNPSQRAKFYLKDLDNWERVDGATDKFGTGHFFFYYRLDPDYTIYLVDEQDEYMIYPKDINDNTVGLPFYYLFAFCNVSYHDDFSNCEKVILYYKDVPLFSSLVESVDEGRTNVVPPKFSAIEPHYIKDSFNYLLFEFMFAYCGRTHSEEAREMFLRVIPVYSNDEERGEFIKYICSKGFTNNEMLGEKIKGDALKRMKNTHIGLYKVYGISEEEESVTKKLLENKDLVINFASLNNTEYNQITESLRKGKMIVDWLEEWRNFRSCN